MKNNVWEDAVTLKKHKIDQEHNVPAVRIRQRKDEAETELKGLKICGSMLAGPLKLHDLKMVLVKMNFDQSQLMTNLATGSQAGTILM